MKFTDLVNKEYGTVSETVIDRAVSPKKEMKLEYEVMPRAGTYAEGVHILRNSYVENESEVPSRLWYECDGQKIVRSLTFRENLLARVDDFETLKNKDDKERTIKDRLRLFDTWLDSCTGIAYSSQDEGDFMIIPVCRELITIPEGFCDEEMQINYASLQGKGFSLKRSQVKWNQLLTESEVMSHPAWIASVEEDITLLCAYASIVFKHVSNKYGKAMGFYLRNPIEKDQLRSLCVSSRDRNSNADGNYNLGSNCVFSRATPPSGKFFLEYILSKIHSIIA